ncbi:hypothetical protein [Chitinophaga polysaccharea]|nr:hypothetical protein [Chitinophaga polysaccharea]
MRKQFITVFLMLIWLCQLSGRYFVMLDFYLNQEYIAKNLCVNRNKPAMHCNGKCHLSKKLKEEEKRDQDNPERKDHRSEIFYAAWLEPTSLTAAVPADIAHYPHPYCIGTPIDQPDTIFHPPAA